MLGLAHGVDRLKRFEPIEGLRAWLAWAVVLGHIILFSGLRRIGIPHKIGEVATVSVQIFIIISGFVITHLLIVRREPYRPYVIRRFFRLFPVLLVCMVAGAIAIAISRTPWPNDPTYEYGHQLIDFKAAQASHLTAHVLLHLTMLHGVIPDNVLNVAQWALLPPAWSVSLEWQFYLVAPFVLILLRKPLGAAVVAFVTVVGLLLYQRGHLGQFALPSFLPGSGYLFLIGVASRLGCDQIKPAYPVAVSIFAVGFGYLMDLTAIGCWVAFFTYMFCDRSELQGIDQRLVRIVDAMFSSSRAQWAGKRTYCVYLVHFPIFQLLLTGLAIEGVRSPVIVACLLLVGVIPLTALFAEVVHRWVELPGMKLGKEVAKRWAYRIRLPDRQVGALARRRPRAPDQKRKIG